MFSDASEREAHWSPGAAWGSKWAAYVGLQLLTLYCTQIDFIYGSGKKKRNQLWTVGTFSGTYWSSRRRRLRTSEDCGLFRGYSVCHNETSCIKKNKKKTHPWRKRGSSCIRGFGAELWKTTLREKLQKRSALLSNNILLSLLWQKEIGV